MVGTSEPSNLPTPTPRTTNRSLGGIRVARAPWRLPPLTFRFRRRFAFLAVLAFVPGAAACGGESDQQRPVAVPGGDTARGALVIRSFDCGSCHVIPGIRGANGLVGPPLTMMGRRAYIAGRLPNEPDAMVRWVLAPHAVDELTAMPNVGLDEQQARDVAAYLYTLR
jgi:cytochrome c